MDKDKVMELIMQVGKELHLNEVETNAILKKYRGFIRYPREHDVPEFRSGRHVIFIWNYVLGSMSEYPHEVQWMEERCPECGERLLRIWLSTPRESWEALAGRAGHMKVCVNCLSQFDYKMELLN